MSMTHFERLVLRFILLCLEMMFSVLPTLHGPYDQRRWNRCIDKLQEEIIAELAPKEER